MPIARILTIAGSDPSGGAGIQADIKTITALGGYAMSAITALTVQNTRYVEKVEAVDPVLVTQQIVACLEDIGADCIKIGLIPDHQTAQAIAMALAAYRDIPIILDPVLTASSGAILARDAAGRHLQDTLISQSFFLTPNLDETSALLGRPVITGDDQAEAAQALAAFGARHVLVKGGHQLDGSGVASTIITDILYSDGHFHYFENKRIRSRNTHGTGCSLASAIACYLAQGNIPATACARAIAFVRNAITHAPGLGGGAGPLHHGYGI